jgi:hypothetical protein
VEQNALDTYFNSDHLIIVMNKDFYVLSNWLTYMLLIVGLI